MTEELFPICGIDDVDLAFARLAIVEARYRKRFPHGRLGAPAEKDQARLEAGDLHSIADLHEANRRARSQGIEEGEGERT